MANDVLRMVDQTFAPGDLDYTFSKVTHTAVELIPACDHASITLRTGGRFQTRGPTHPAALIGDRLQYQAHQGPCLDALTKDEWVSSPDVRADERWPRFTSKLPDDLQVGSMLSLRLFTRHQPERVMGGLNMYSMRRAAFDGQQREMALLLAAIAAAATDAALRRTQLEKAMASRELIGEAVGIVRAQRNLSSKDAFSALTEQSERLKLSLRDLAAQVTERMDLPQAG